MTRPKRLDMNYEREKLNELNNERHCQAIDALDRLIRERLKTKRPGAFGIRVTFNRNRLGSIREIREDEVA